MNKALHIEVSLHAQPTGSLVSLPFICLSRSKSQSELEWQNEDNKKEIHLSPVNHRMRADWSRCLSILYTTNHIHSLNQMSEAIVFKLFSTNTEDIFIITEIEQWNRKHCLRIFLKENSALILFEIEKNLQLLEC